MYLGENNVSTGTRVIFPQEGFSMEMEGIAYPLSKVTLVLQKFTGFGQIQFGDYNESFGASVFTSHTYVFRAILLHTPAIQRCGRLIPQHWDT
jgi:hypothetical protein